MGAEAPSHGGGYRCWRCGYSLQGTTTARCPECGADEFHLGEPARPADAARHSVFDEPTFSPELAGGVPADATSYRSFLRNAMAGMSRARSWAIASLIALAAGPMAVAGTFVGAFTGENRLGTGSGAGLIGVAVVGPIIEEIMKVSVAAVVVERRPWWFRSPRQILLCGLASGLAFAAIENLLYIHVYVSNPGPGFVRWRWTVCVAIHTVCSVIAALGIARVWSKTVTSGREPDISHAFPALASAAIIHGMYNAVVTVTAYQP